MGIIGLGSGIVVAALTAYLVEACLFRAASSIAANIFVGFIGGALLPLAGPKMYGALGMGWGNTLLAFVAATLLIPMSLFLLRCGEQLRNRYRSESLWYLITGIEIFFFFFFSKSMISVAECPSESAIFQALNIHY